MSLAENETLDTAPAAEEGPVLGRDGFLAAAGKLAERVLLVDGLGRVLIGELSGADRADIIEKQAVAYQDKKLAVKSYQRDLLMRGILDPSSPEGARTPLFRAADMDQVMRVGGAKIAKIVAAVEELSGLGAAAQKSAEGNSDVASDSSTSA